jgi:putative membrane protein
MRNKPAILSLILILSSFTYAFVIETDIKSIDTVLSEIRIEEKLQNNEKINPEMVSPELLEKLGDSVMEKTVGNHNRHEQIDKMMGGHGSAALTVLHQGIGYSYLTGNLTGMGMVNSGMMQAYPELKYGMMWNNSGMIGYGGWILGIIVFIILIFFIGFVLFFSLRKNRKETSLDILKIRFAKGKISTEDFGKMKKELEK